MEHFTGYATLSIAFKLGSVDAEDQQEAERLLYPGPDEICHRLLTSIVKRELNIQSLVVFAVPTAKDSLSC